jgi:hypothetical protein
MKQWIDKYGHFAFAAFCIGVIIWALSGCGSNIPIDPKLSVEVACEPPIRPFAAKRCTVFVRGATNVEAFYGHKLAWYDRNISNPEDRQTYVDGVPFWVREFTVVACNEAEDCVEDSVRLR